MTTAAAPLYAHRSAAETASGSSAPFDTTYTAAARLDVTVSALTGGTTPDITFSLQGQGADGTWYTLWSGTAIDAAGVQSAAFGPGTANAFVFGGATRLTWTFGGAVVATSITFSASLIGRS